MPNFPVDHPIPEGFEVRKFGEQPWIWVPPNEAVEKHGNHPDGPVKAMASGAKLPAKDHIARIDNTCNEKYRTEDDGAWHEFPCPHFHETIELDSEMLYNPETGQLTPASMATYMDLFSLGHEPVSRTMDSTKVPGSGRFRF